MSSQLMRATIARFEAERQEALAVVELFLNASVGVGDHPNVINELQSAVIKMASAEEALESLSRNFLTTSKEQNAPDSEDE